MRRQPNVAALIWGLLFICIAVAGALIGSDLLTDLTMLALIGPVVLIGLGVLGLVLSNKN